MRVHLKNNGHALSAEFPMTVFEMQDALDKLKIPDNKSIVAFEISEYDNMEFPFALCLRDFSTDIYRLNLFAERLERLNFSEITAFRSLLKVNPESNFEDILKMTYGLDSVMIYPCSDCRELGETVIENEMMPEIESCSDKILELLDREKIGKIMQEREGGVFINEHYCVTSGYETPDIHIEIGRPESCFFRLLIVPMEEKIEQAQWISLPCETEITADFYNGICLDFQSALPNLRFDDAHKIDMLNELAEQTAQLSHNDFVKLKAVMESEKIHEISDALNCIKHLSKYEFDAAVQDYSEFGKAYLARNLPVDFDISVLEGIDLYDFSSKILKQTGGEVTSYGVVSARGQSLYSALSVQQEEQLAEELEEDFEMGMGGLSL